MGIDRAKSCTATVDSCRIWWWAWHTAVGVNDDDASFGTCVHKLAATAEESARAATERMNLGRRERVRPVALRRAGEAEQRLLGDFAAIATTGKSPALSPSGSPSVPPTYGDTMCSWARECECARAYDCLGVPARECESVCIECVPVGVCGTVAGDMGRETGRTIRAAGI